MRSLPLLFVAVLLFTADLSAADLKITITDPQSAAIVGAKVSLYPDGASNVIASAITSPDGVVRFSNLPSGNYRGQAIAPGFAPNSFAVKLPAEESVHVRLEVATASQTVVVSAARSPIPEQEAGVPVELLDENDLTNLQPVSQAEALRFLPGAIVSNVGQRGGQSSLFVRGGESNYNKVIIDGVAVNEEGGFFDFGVVPLQQANRLEFVRGPESTLYGSDAMTSVVQLWTATGRTRVPEVRFGAAGGNLSTADGFASIAGAAGRFDYNLFGDQFNTEGQGVNDDYSNSSQGGNIGVKLAQKVFFRVRARHSNNRSGVQSNWNFNGQPLLPPDSDQFARQNNFLSSADLSVNSSAHWEHRFSGFEYHHRRSNVDTFVDPGRGCDTTFLDCPFNVFVKLNRAGFEYQGAYSPRSWAQTIFGYHFEDENGHFGQLPTGPFDPGSDNHGLRRNPAVYGQQVFTFSRLSVIPGIRFEHNESFGNKAVPRITATFLALRGNELFSGTRLRFAYGLGIKAPSFEQSFGIPSFLIAPNPTLKPEEARSLEAGVQQNFLSEKVSLSASYFNNLFTNEIECCETLDAAAHTLRYFNVNSTFAHGAEIELHSRPRQHIRMDASYTYTATQILVAPLQTDPMFSAGAPLIRRPRHSATVLLSYYGNRWGASLAGIFIGRRPDSDFTFGVVPPFNHVAGYARLDPGFWYQINHYATAYVNVENALDKSYQEVVGYPGLGVNLRAGMRFRIGGD